MGTSHTRRAALALLGSLVAFPALADFADAFPSPGEAARVNERTVGVVFERDDRLFDLMEDIGTSLDLAAGLRIVPIVGRNHVQNVYDLLYLEGVDFALARSDSIEYVRRATRSMGTPDLVRTVARTGNEKIVVIARDAHTTLDELAGRPVAFGRPGSGEFVTGTLVFDSLGIEIEKIEAGGAEALARVRSGELDAMVHLLGSPGAFAAGPGMPGDGVSVVALAPDDRLAGLYHLATLDATDLPTLIPAGESVPTHSVDVNLLAYAWSAPNARTPRMEQFVKALVDRLEALQGGRSQPEWEEISLDARTPNVDGSPMVAQAIAEREAALERWHERRRLVRQAETGTRSVYVEQRVSDGRTVIRRLDGQTARGEASGTASLLDGLDTPLTEPAGRATPFRTGGNVADERTGRLGPMPSEPSSGGPGG